MHYTVRLLRRRGMRLTRAEIDAAPAFTGNLVISDWREGNTARRAIRIAQLWDASASAASRRPLLLPLLDPVLTRMTTDDLVLYGTELESVDSRLYERVQGWWARPAE